MTKLSRSYIEQHMNTSHTYAEFGRLMVDIILQKAMTAVGTAEMDKITLNVEVEVSAFMPTDCIKICAKTEDGEQWCTNQFADEVYLQS